jgi:hypothetical protein
MLSNVKDSLNKFGKYVVQQSRTNLTKGKKNVSKSLYDSVGYDLKVSPNSFSLSFIMDEYGMYQDKGVRGKDPSKVSKNAQITGQQAPNSPFRFGSGTHKGTWPKFVENLEGWVKKKRVRLRVYKTVNGKQVPTGKFAKGNYKSVAYIVAGNIYNRGIKPSLFFTKPFEKAFDNLPDEVIEAFGLDIKEFLQFTTK